MRFVVLSRKKVIAVISLIVALIVLSTIVSVSVISVSSNGRKLPIYSVKTEEKKLAISFDCAWGTDYTDELLNVMSENDIKCTFFMVEFWTEKHPDFVKKISDLGHEIGTHSATHPHMSKMGKSAIEKELKSSKKAISDITNKPVELFRAPFGEYNNTVIETAYENGLYTIQWDVDSLDWKDLSASEITARVLGKVKNGSIVLFHNQGKHTAEGIKRIIPELKKQGYTFVTIGELIYKSDYSILPDGTQIRNN
ncbi:MAG: deacetylase [Clostridiales bacterium]|nr:deacetylase [Clostridiales bacterium]